MKSVGPRKTHTACLVHMWDLENPVSKQTRWERTHGHREGQTEGCRRGGAEGVGGAEGTSGAEGTGGEGGQMEKRRLAVTGLSQGCDDSTGVGGAVGDAAIPTRGAGWARGRCGPVTSLGCTRA